MPIHLPPLSRRRFLARSLAAGAGVALAPAALAAVGRATNTDSWALLSDIHVAANRAQLGRGINMTDHVMIVAAELLTLPERPAGVFITGDCAYNSGEAGDYAVVADLLKPIREDQMPVHLALGNHDSRDHFWEAFAEEKAAKRPLADRQASLLATERANWFILDSLEKTQSTPGLLGPDQLAWLAKTLDENPGKPALVIIHHNPGISGNIGLKDTVEFFEVIRPRKQVKAYIYGHTHAWKVEQETSGIHLINLPPVSYNFHEGDPTGWVHATLGKQGMRLELRCLETAHRAHGEVRDLVWRS